MPAVAVRHGRLVLFIFNGFKGYLDGSSSLRGDGISRVLYEKGSTTGGEMKFDDTFRTGKGEGNLLCKN